MATWHVKVKGKESVLVTVHGEVGVDDAAEAALTVKDILVEGGIARDICFDIREISSYSLKAREEWSALLKQHRKLVAGLTWVTQRSTHRMVGRAVGLFTGIPTTILDDMPPSLRELG